MRTVEEARDAALVDILDRVLDRGVILAGDITISVADVDLIFLGLKVMLASVDSAEQMRWGIDRGRNADLDD